MLFKDRAFLTVFTGQAISSFGSGVGGAALELTALLTLRASAAEMGLLAALRSAPLVVLGLFAGVWADRVRRRPLMIAADLGRALLLTLVPLAAYLGWLSLPLLYIVAPLVGALGVLFVVAYQSYVPVLVRRPRPELATPVDGEDAIREANSRFATSDALAEITTPGLGGFLVTVLTAPLTILIDALSFVLSAISIALVQVPEPPPAPADGAQRMIDEVREGLSVVLSNPTLRAIAGFNGTCAFFGNFIGALYAIFLLRELGLGPVLLGVTVGVGGVSNLLGTLLVNPVTRRLGVGRTIMWSVLAGSFFTLLIPLAAGPAPLAFAIICLAQASDLIHPLTDVNILTVRQASAPERLLGRVNASMQVLEGSLAPVGALVGGLLAESIGVRGTLAISAAGLLASRFWLVFSPVAKLRRVEDLVSPQTGR